MFPPVATVCVDGETERVKGGRTVMVTVSGLGSVEPELSVTVREAVYVPGVE